jgi:hypothetical protein
MYFMSRKVGQLIRVRPSSLVDPSTPVGELFKKPIGLLLYHSSDEGARFVVYADDRMLVIEDELVRER